jgi:hypothetical protein
MTRPDIESFLALPHINRKSEWYLLTAPLVAQYALEKERECERVRKAIPAADEIERIISDNTSTVDGGVDAYVSGCGEAANAILEAIRTALEPKP